MKIRIGSRTSKLALKQVEIAMKRIGAPSFEIIGVDTAGEKISRENKVQFDKKNFVEDIDNLIVDKKIDIAIHSAKDMPAVSNISDLDEIYISNDLVQNNEKYNSRNDILIFRKNEHPVFKKNMKIGTSSLRRRLQLLATFPSFEYLDLRGNVDTRLHKLNSGEYDAIVLAVSGLHRLGLSRRITERISTDLCLPAAGQGAIGIECRSDDSTVRELIAPLNDKC